MKQGTFTDMEYSCRKKKTKRKSSGILAVLRRYWPTQTQESPILQVRTK